MMKKIVSILLCASIISPSVCFADDAEISPIKAGDAAPFEGILLNPNATANIISDKKLEPERISAEVERIKSIINSECNLRINNMNIDLEKNKKFYEADISVRDAQIVALNEVITKKQKQIEMTPYYVGGGVAGGIIATLLTTFIVLKSVD